MSIPLSLLMFLGWSLIWIASLTLLVYQWGSRSIMLTLLQIGICPVSLSCSETAEVWVRENRMSLSRQTEMNSQTEKPNFFCTETEFKTAKLRPKNPVPSSWLKNDTYLSLAFVHYSTLLDTAVKDSDHMGFLGKKKTLQVGPALHYVTETLFWLVAHNFMWHDPIHEPIHDLIRDLVRNPIRSDPSDDWPRDCRMRQSVTQSWGTEKWRNSLCGKLSLVSFYFSLGFLLAKEIIPWMERFITQMGEFALFIPFLSQSIWSLG